MDTWTSAAGSRRDSRRLAALMIAAALALVAAVPAFAQDEGGSLEPQVVGGSSVPNGKYPFMASLQADFPGDGTAGKRHFCGATLIDRSHVLTAAHCVEFFGGQISVGRLRVVVGVTVLGSGQGQFRSVDRLGDIAVHPRYTGARSSRYDAAVIELSRSVSGIRPIKLLTPRNNGPERAGNRTTITGWGTTREDARRSPKRMQEGHPDIVSDRAGKRAYGGQYEPRLMVAAGKGRVDTCQGDSGGPMFDRVGGTRRQFGITSFGRGCAQEGYPGIYTEVNNPSISQFIRRESSL